MGSIWQSAPSNSLGPGVYGISVAPPPTLPAEGTMTACIVEQFPWGPSLTVYDPTDLADLILTFFPPGMPWNSAGPLAVMGKGWPDLRVSRVTGGSGSPAAAAATIASSSPTTLYTCTLNSIGTAGNSVVWTVAAASNGVTSQHNLTVSVTGLSGTTTDTFVNVDNTSAATLAATTAAGMATARLVGAFTWSASGTAATGTGDFSGGSNGTVAATDYVGTVGLGDKGLALTEGVPDINLICFGDPGSSFRATANAGMQAHLSSLGRRFGFITGNSGQSASAAQTDVASYRLDQLAYVDPWMKKISPQDGTVQTVPAAALAMSVASQLQPSTHISWRDPSVAAMMVDVYAVEATRGQQSLVNDAAGIVTLVAKSGGGFAFYTDPTSNKPSNPSQPDIGTIRMGQYIIVSAIEGFQSNVNGPNVPYTQNPMRAALQQFLNELVANASNDPAHNPYLKAASLGDPVTSNPESQLDAGDYSIPVFAQTDLGMIRIFIPIQYGPGVSAGATT